MVLTYHNIGAEPGFNTVAQSSLKEQLAYISGNYEVVSVDEYVNYLIANGKSKDGAAVISFDDAYVSFAELAMPLLREQELPVALFVCTGVIGKTNEWDSPNKRIPVMNEGMIRMLSTDSLITIGAHTDTHRSLTSLGERDLRDEMNIPRRKLEELTGKPVNYLAYPYGQLHLNVSNEVKKAALDAGYKAAFSTNFGNSNSSGNIYALNRIDITGADSMDGFISKLKPANYYYYKQKVKNIYSRIKTM